MKKYNSLPASQASIFLIGAQIFLSKQELSRKLHAEILSIYAWESFPRKTSKEWEGTYVSIFIFN